MKNDELKCTAFILVFMLIVLSPLLLFAFAMWCDKVDRDKIADVAKRYDAMMQPATVSPQQKEKVQKEDNDNVQMTKVTFSDWLKTPIGSTARGNVMVFMNNFPKLPLSVKNGLSEHILKQKFMHNDTCARIYMRIDENFERHHNDFTEVHVRDEMIRFVVSTWYGNAISTCELVFN